MTETVSPGMVEKLVELVRDMAAKPMEPGWLDYDRARAIAAELPAPVDSDEQEVERVIAQYELHTNTAMSGRLNSIAKGVALAAIKRGRALAGEAQSEWGFKPAPVDPDEQYARDLIKAQGWSGEPSIGGEAVVLMIATAHRHGRTQGDR